MDPFSCMLSFGLACAPAPPQPAPEPAIVEPAAPDAPSDASAASSTGAASEVLGKVQRFYDGTKDLKASFSQTYVHPVYGTKTLSSGTLQVKRPGMMIWDYAKKADPDFYADGNTLWVIERDTRQVVKKDVQSSDFAGAVKFLFGGRKIIEDFWVRFASETLGKRYGMADHDVIELKPKKTNPHYKRLLLVVNRTDGRVDGFVVRNGDDSTNHFVLSGLTANNGLSAASFKFKPPAGYVVIEE